MIRKAILLFSRLVLIIGLQAVVVFITLVVGVGFQARGGPELQAWHRVHLESEFTRERAGEIATLADYLRNEEALFAELEQKVVSSGEGNRVSLNRFVRTSISYPQRGEVNFNRSREIRLANPRGAVLMLHGLTDGPYSMRHLQQIFYAQGFYVLNLRLPAHGTTPGELSRIDWRDWMAAVELGARHARAQAGADQPFWILGYSNGAALALKHALNALEQGGPARPDQLVLVSPMIGVSRLARFGKWFTLLGKARFFEKSLWLDILPEYDPHKYNSFPNNAVRQSRELTLAIQAQMARLDKREALGGLPPVLAFQSLVDSTVQASAVFENLYARLPANGSELVVFDVNRSGAIDEFIRPAVNALLNELLNADLDHYSLSLIVNAGPETRNVVEWHKPAGSMAVTERELGLVWPEAFYSLSHVALPFPPDDKIYGYLDPGDDTDFPWLGWVNWLGENGALTLPASVYTRARSNPFFSYMELRLQERINRKQ